MKGRYDPYNSWELSESLGRQHCAIVSSFSGDTPHVSCFFSFVVSRARA